MNSGPTMSSYYDSETIRVLRKKGALEEEPAPSSMTIRAEVTLVDFVRIIDILTNVKVSIIIIKYIICTFYLLLTTHPSLPKCFDMMWLPYCGEMWLSW